MCFLKIRDNKTINVYINIYKCQEIRGNHEQNLAEYIGTYYQTPERKRAKLDTYPYNTFELLQERLTPVDIQSKMDRESSVKGGDRSKWRKIFVSSCNDDKS